ncbi:MAG: glycine cleavage system aminomethyltransferase GcvT [Planctomycetota bacterium]
MSEPKTTPLHGFHAEHGGNMVDFAGWSMPMTYTGIIDEHRQVRTSGGVFDVSHMGRLRLQGRHARRLLEKACSRRISDMQHGQCRYSLMLNESGGVKDDVIVYRLDDDEFLVVVNAANRTKIVEHLTSLIEAEDLKLKLDDQTESTAMVALQGPRVMQLVSQVSKEVPTLKKYRFVVKNLLVIKLIVSRTGYTGEDGVEVILPAGATGMALKLLMKDVDPSQADALMRPAGLGARDTLRLEAGMPLYGHELGEDINALSSGLGFAISLDKEAEDGGEAFIGQRALIETQERGGPDRLLVGLFIDGPRTARQGMTVHAGGEHIGLVTSGCKSPTLDRSIAMALVAPEYAEIGTRLEIETGRATLAAEVTALPFYKVPKSTISAPITTG